MKNSKVGVSALLKTPLGRNMAFFLLLTCLAVVAINVWTLWFSWQQKLTERANETHNLSVSLARQAEDAFLQVDITLSDAVRQLNQHGIGYAASAVFSRQLKEQHGRLPQLHGLFVYDAQGNWLATSGSYMPARGSNADRDYFIWHKTHPDKGVHISHVIRSRSTGELVIPVSMRLDDSAGRFAGVALATVKIDYFRHLYDYYILAERDVIGLIAADASVVYIRPFPDSVINQSVSTSPLFKSALKTATSGSATWRSALDGVERIYGYARLQQYPLIVATGYDRDRIWRDWLMANLSDVVLNAILLAMITLMGWLLLRQVGANVRKQLELTQVRDELMTINHRLQSLALIDELTGLANRRQFDALLEQSLQRSHKSGEPLSLIVIDLDFFKRYNEANGHIEGDLCLRRIGAILKGLPQQQGDFVARYSGEAFAMILPFTNAPDARRIAERAIKAIREARISHQSSELADKIVTASAGCCTLIASGQSGEAERLIARVHKALHKARSNGRNRVEVSG